MRPFALHGAVLVLAVDARAQDVLHRWYGRGAYDGLPRAIAVGGDTDGDGVPDVMLSAGGAPPSPPPHVCMQSGRTGSVLFDLADPFAGHDFGDGLAFLGDTDGDGFGEFAIGSMAVDDKGTKNGKGYVKAYAGADAHELWTLAGNNADDGFGAPLEAADFDGDGIRDLLISALGAEEPGFPSDTGVVYVMSGATQGEIRRHRGLASGDYFGHALATGDFNGDGRADYVIAARHAGMKNAGTVYVFDGSGTSLYSLVGSVRYEWFGHSLSTIGDLNGDGCDDFIVGAPFYGTLNWREEGQAYVYSGVDGTLIRSHIGPTFNTWEGWEVAGIGDCDANGSPDYALGRRLDGNQAGAVLLYSGATGGLLKQIDGTVPGELLGYQIGGGTDVDQDGYSDVVAAAPGDSQTFNLGGRVDVLTIAEHPRPLNVTPSRLRYENAPTNTFTITGRHFLVQPILSVEIDGIAATNVTAIDDSTPTCDAPDGAPGPAEVAVSSVLGVGRIAGAFRRTPSTDVQGDFVSSGSVLVTYEFDLYDSLFAFVGVGPRASIPVHGFDGDLCISPFVILFAVTRWPSDEFQLFGTIPSDPGLVGIEVLLQGLIGPSFSGPAKDAAWTDCASFVIR